MYAFTFYRFTCILKHKVRLDALPHAHIPNHNVTYTHTHTQACNPYMHLNIFIYFVLDAQCISLPVCPSVRPPLRRVRARVRVWTRTLHISIGGKLKITHTPCSASEKIKFSAWLNMRLRRWGVNVCICMNRCLSTYKWATIRSHVCVCVPLMKTVRPYLWVCMGVWLIAGHSFRRLWRVTWLAWLLFGQCVQYPVVPSNANEDAGKAVSAANENTYALVWVFVNRHIYICICT